MRHAQRTFILALTLALIISIAAPLLAKQMQGRITAVRPAKMEFVVSEGFKDFVFQVDNGTKITVNQRDATLADLKPGDETAVMFEIRGKVLVATNVRAVGKR